MAEKSSKLHEVLAVQPSVKSVSHKRGSEDYKLLQKPELFNGLIRTYEPLADDGERLPDESKRIQHSVMELLERVAAADTEWLDVEATIDVGNTQAKSDIEIDGNIILTGVTVSTLLTLKKYLSDMHAQIEKVPTLSLENDWSLNTEQGHYASKPVVSSRSKKIQKPVTITEATDKHPERAELVSEDVPVGHWTSTKISKALPPGEKQEMLRRVELLQRAVDEARQRANATEVTKVRIGQRLSDFILKGK